MTKKELQNLHSQKCIIERVLHQNRMGYVPRNVVSFSLSDNELSALRRTLNDAASESNALSYCLHLDADLNAFLENAIELEKDQKT